MANTATYVTAGKPAVGGAIYRAPLGTTLPSNAYSTLGADWVCLGYCSDDGLSNNNSPESDTRKAWGGDTVLTFQTGKEDTFGFTLIETLNADVLKTIYGATHVTGSLASGITVEATADEPEEFCWCFDMIMRGGALKRIVLPDAKISEVGEISYSDTEAVGYAVTLTAMPDIYGVTHYEHLMGAPTVVLNKNSTTIEVLNTETLTATTNPAGGTVTWQSSDDSIAEVSSGGVVSAISEGSCIITAKFGQAHAACKVTVEAGA